MPAPIAAKFLAAAREMKANDTALKVGAGAPPPVKPAGTPPAPPSIDQLVDSAFSRFDQNADLKISTAEMVAVLNPKAKWPLVEKIVNNLVARHDTSKDGVLDKPELSAAIGALDKNGDGAIGRHDLQHGPDALIALVGVLPHDLPPGG